MRFHDTADFFTVLASLHPTILLLLYSVVTYIYALYTSTLPHIRVHQVVN